MFGLTRCSLRASSSALRLPFMLKLLAKGPIETGHTCSDPHPHAQPARPARPLSAAPGDIDPAIVISSPTEV